LIHEEIGLIEKLYETNLKLYAVVQLMKNLFFDLKYIWLISNVIRALLKINDCLSFCNRINEKKLVLANDIREKKLLIKSTIHPKASYFATKIILNKFCLKKEKLKKKLAFN